MSFSCVKNRFEAVLLLIKGLYGHVIDYSGLACPGCNCYCVARGASLQLLLTQTDIVVEKREEVTALFSEVATACAGTPGSHVGGGVVKIVGSYCASCRGKMRGDNAVLDIYSHVEAIQLDTVTVL